MELTNEEHAWFTGGHGPAIQRAMEIVVTLGNIYGAERLIPVQSVQISGVSYRNLGAPGLDFLRRWAAEGAQVQTRTTLNPTAMDMQAWEIQGFDADFAQKQREVVDIFAQMGVGDGHPTPTCTPYYLGGLDGRSACRDVASSGDSIPTVGTSIAWAESSAVSYANSVLGARTNREGGPGAIAAALTGRTAAYGLHLDAEREPTHHVDVQVPPHTIEDYSALGALVGKTVKNRIPYFTGLPLTPDDPLWREKLKALGAAMAATGAVALYYVADFPPLPFTDGAPSVGSAPFPNNTPIAIRDLTPGYAMLNDPNKTVDLVWIGCPHASLMEIERITEAVAGQRLQVPLWITCARPIKEAAIKRGFGATLEAAGGQIFADACMAIAPVRDLGFNTVATTSAKGAFYLRNLAGVAAHFGSLDRCIEAAHKGRWA
jgi:hypothetical protein